MGHVFHLNVYLSQDDLLSVDKNKTSTLLRADIHLINNRLNVLMSVKIESEQFKQNFEQLVFDLQQFIIRFKQEIKYATTLKFELLKLLTKLKVLARYLGSSLIDTIAPTLFKFIHTDMPTPILNELLIFETYASLGLMPQLSGQDKLWVKKVKHLDLYSELLSDYKKPQILKKHTEHYFQKNRSELLMNLVATDKKITHIHYDVDYLEAYSCSKLIIELMGQNMNDYLNQRIERELLS